MHGEIWLAFAYRDDCIKNRNFLFFQNYFFHSFR